MAEKKKEAAEAPSGGKKKLVIIIVAVLVLLLLIGGGVTAYLLMKKSADEAKESKDPAKQVPVPELSAQADIGPQVTIEEFIVNIISGDTAHYVKASLVLEMTSEEGKGEVEKRMPQVRDAVLLLIGSKTFEELQDLQGKKQLKAEITSKINTFLKSGKVRAVYFTNFVVQ